MQNQLAACCARCSSRARPHSAPEGLAPSSVRLGVSWLEDHDEGGAVRVFNTTGLCVPRKHYMVDISKRVEKMRAMVMQGDYFCMNRPRQYGKTTALSALEDALRGECEVVRLDFQGLSHEDFRSEGMFARAFAAALLDELEPDGPDGTAWPLGSIADAKPDGVGLSKLFRALRAWLRGGSRRVVLVIDEVDSATNNQVFLDFLAQLRQQYLRREETPSSPAFQSVILAGVTDVKHIKAKIRPEDQARPNSPWNIAADFDVEMGFSSGDIQGMLAEYEADHTTGMDIAAVAAEIYSWTGGYPFLVSRVCQLVDERGLRWDHGGIDRAVRLLLADDDVSLFESLMGQMERHPEMKERLRLVLLTGEEIDFSPYDETQKLLRMYGFAMERGGKLVVANRIFETLLCNHFLAEERCGSIRNAAIVGRSRFVQDGRLDMRAVLEGFRRAYGQAFGPLVGRFPEKDGRELFLLYLKPIINGTGNYYIEAQTRDQTRTDVVVDYAGEQFVVELKIWRGQARHEEGEEQLRGYLDYFGLATGYMLSFNFNQHKEPGLRRVVVGDKVIWEETV